MFVHFAEVGDRILLGYPFFLQYRLGFLPTKKCLIPTELLKIRKGPGGYQTRYLSSLKPDSAGGRRTLVQFSELLVTGFWGLECHPDHSLWVYRHVIIAVCHQSLLDESDFWVNGHTTGLQTKHCDLWFLVLLPVPCRSR